MFNKNQTFCTFSAIVLLQPNNDVKTTLCPKSKRKLTLIGFWKICQDHLEKGLLTIFLIGTQHSNHTAASTQQYSSSLPRLVDLSFGAGGS